MRATPPKKHGALFAIADGRDILLDVTPESACLRWARRSELSRDLSWVRGSVQAVTMAEGRGEPRVRHPRVRHWSRSANAARIWVPTPHLHSSGRRLTLSQDHEQRRLAPGEFNEGLATTIRRVIQSQSVRLSANFLRPERRSTDGQTILK